MKEPIDKQALLEELKIQFEATKARLKFKATYEEINSVCYIEDLVLAQGFVSNQFSRQMINRMVEGPYSWLSDLHNWLLPSPHNLITLNEGKNITPENKKEVSAMIDKIMYLFRKNKRIAFNGLIKTEEGAFVDEMYNFLKNDFNKFMLKYHQKLETFWENETKKDSK